MNIPELKHISSPPIPPLKQKAESLRNNPDFMDLSQAIPGYPPPENLIEFTQKVVKNPLTHLYSPDPGLLSFREILTEKIRNFNEIISSPENIIVTAGANQAYLMTIMGLMNPKDEMLLISPYYFNHLMALQLQQCCVKEILITPENICEDLLNQYLTPQTKGITIVNPGNPSGISYSREFLTLIGRWCRKNNLFIISDETYEYFSSSSHTSIASIEDFDNFTFTITSFSKTYALTGWRLGYLISPRGFTDTFIKIQDTMIICAPRISQLIGEFAVQNCQKWLLEKTSLFQKLQSVLLDFNFTTPYFNKISHGAFFACLSYNSKIHSLKLCETLLTETQLLTLPGEAFSMKNPFFIRIAIGAVSEFQLLSALNRLNNFS